MSLLPDLRLGARALAKRPAFTLVAVLALALGIGANATIFSLVNALLLRPPIAADPERIVNVHAISRDGSGFHAFSWLDYRDYRHSTAFTELAAWTLKLLSLSTGDEARVTPAQVVSSNYFEVFGLQPAIGRYFEPAEDEAPRPEVVIGHGLWRRLGGGPEVLGRTLHVNNRALTVIGVAPEGFTGAFGGVATELYVPLSQQPWVEPGVELENRGFVWLEMIGRLAPGISPPAAEASMMARHGQIAEAAGLPAGGGIALGELGTVPGQMRGGVGAFMAILMTMVGLLLTITCVNVAGMLLSRAAGRRREIAVRLAIGAGRARLVRQLITETLMLFALGGVAGAVLAHWASRLFLAVELPLPVPLDLQLGVDSRVLAFTFGITLLTGLIFGLAPALQATRVDLCSSLKDEGASDGSRRLRLRSAFVVAQVAVALVLLIGAGLFMKSLETAATVDPGFVAAGVHLASIDLELHGYSEQAGADFYDRLRRRLESRPSVGSVSLARTVPLGFGNSTTGFNVPGHDPPPGDSAHQADANTVDVSYFETMKIQVVAGRGFNSADRAGGPEVAVINAALAERFWPAENPIGQTIQLGTGTAEIVGVAADGRYRSLNEEKRFYIYSCFAQNYSPRMTLHVRAREDLGKDLEAVALAVREEIRALDAHLPISQALSLEQYTSVSLLPQRVASAVTGIFGLLGLLLVAVGVYGVSAFAVSQRRREFGLRMAVGAESADVLGLVLGQGLKLASIGLALGWAAAFALTRALASLLYGISATDPLIFGTMSLVLVGIVQLGCLFPAWRATRVEPLKALRYE